jgi:hypothetical protein
MRTTRFLTSIAVVGVAATTLAAPSAAQGGVDQAFIDEVHKKGVPIASDAQAVELAHSTCGVLSSGGSAADALNNITKATNWSQQQATDFGGLAVVAYCGDQMDRALASIQEGEASAPPPKTGPRLNVTDGPALLPLPPPTSHSPYGGRFGPQDSSPFS